MKALWAGLALLMSISSAQSCPFTRPFDLQTALEADLVVIGRVKNYHFIEENGWGTPRRAARFSVLSNRIIKGDTDNEFSAEWRPGGNPVSSVRSPPWHRGRYVGAAANLEDQFLLGFRYRYRSGAELDQKTYRPIEVETNTPQLIEETCRRPFLFKANSPEAQAVIEILGKQTEAEQ